MELPGWNSNEKSGHPRTALILRLETLLAPVPVVISVMIPVFVATVVVISIPHFVAVPVCLVAIAVSISIPRYLPAAVPAVVAVMIIDYRALISRKAPVAVVGIVIVSPAVVSVVIVPDEGAETRIISEASFVLTTPFPIFPLALTVQPVVVDIAIPALSQPFPVVRIVGSVITTVPAITVIGISIPMLRASSSHNCSQSQS
jgi:hypothetical protein